MYNFENNLMAFVRQFILISLIFIFGKCDICKISIDSTNITTIYGICTAHSSIKMDEWRSYIYLDSYGCDVADYDSKTSYSSKFVIVNRGNCTFTQKAELAQNNSASGIVILSEKAVGTMELSRSVSIQVIMVKTPAEDIFKYSQQGKIIINQLSNEYEEYFSFAILFGLAWISVVAGIILKSKLCYFTYIRTKQPAIGDISVKMSLIAVCILISASVTVLLLLYFFFDYLVYVFMVIFIISTTVAFTFMFLPLIHRVPICFIENRRSATFNYDMETRQNVVISQNGCGTALCIKAVILSLIGFSIAIVWFIFRNSWFAWIIQDFLGLILCIFILCEVKLPNFKIIFCYTFALLIYDVFFVFVSALFTKDGVSIMEKAAVGNNKETVPLAFRVPRLPLLLFELPLDAKNIIPQSLLGYGDVVVPGILCCYAASFGYAYGTKSYAIVGCFSYILGLFITLVSLILMEKGQPALLYLIPVTFSAVVLNALRRREFKLLWHGIHDSPSNYNAINDDNERQGSN